MNHRTCAGLLIAGTVWAGTASAVPLVNHSGGVKLLVGADVWSAPSNPPRGLELGFVDIAGGFGYGAVGYYELRIVKFIGLEADLAFQHGTFQRKITYNDVFEYKEQVNTNALRLPLLAKFNLPTTFGRFWLGVGPEFTIYQGSSAVLEQTGGPTAPLPLTMRTRDVKPVYGTMGLGMVIELPLIDLEIPIELRASKNLNQPSEWSDRVSANVPEVSETIRAESSWVFRLGAGLGYRF